MLFEKSIWVSASHFLFEIFFYRINLIILICNFIWSFYLTCKLRKTTKTYAWASSSVGATRHRRSYVCQTFKACCWKSCLEHKWRKNTGFSYKNKKRYQRRIIYSNDRQGKDTKISGFSLFMIFCILKGLTCRIWRHRIFTRAPRRPAN